MHTIFIESEFVSTSKDFPNNISFDELSEKLYKLTGIELDDMNIQFVYKDKPNQSVEFNKSDLNIDLSNVEKITVLDTNENSIVNQLKQSGLDQNETHSSMFKLSDEEYLKRKDSVLNWKMNNKLGRFDPVYNEQLEKNRLLQQQQLQKLELNQRCLVKSFTGPYKERRGWLRYIGKVPEINNDDIWCGIEFDKPVGKNDGSIKGKRYFGPLNPNYGGFVKPICVITDPKYIPINEDDMSDGEI